jgi:hypothetical protein
MQIENYREQNESVKYLALFDIYLPYWHMTLHNWKLWKGKRGYYATGPSYCVEKKLQHGPEREFHPYISFSKEKGKEFQESILKALEPHIGHQMSSRGSTQL